MQPFTLPAEDISKREASHIESLGRPVAFSPDGMAELERAFTRYPTKRAVVLPALWVAQRELGWVPREAIEYVAKLCEVPESHVYSVVSFYTMFNRVPRGRYHLQLCTNISCQLRGAEHILDCLRRKLGCDLGRTTADGLFSLDEVECLAACEMAPMIQVNDEFVGPLTPASAEELVDRLRGEAAAGGASSEPVGTARRETRR